ncbi:hypothetical protein [Rhodoferax antarcticus]|uniref:Uncharacterized protein n=1 Tax=Rhodoferax antarcticus ANT.BR TaxID=1111071 RepID=A0A1Q8Y8R4_9BURK|nr:hypothetical protein [Rhodoferax antarcticus]OLP04442.1 hypothetical protein BLL52_4295 [Rhodoferax antarcticus ANT.BR]
MSKTFAKIKATRPWVRHIDDERGDGSGIIVTLEKSYDFADDKGCGVKGFDTVAEVRSGTSSASIVKNSMAAA